MVHQSPIPQRLQRRPRGGRDFVGIGPLGTQSPIFKDGFINQAQMDELTARGGIGEILGRFIDAQGDVVDSEINRMITSYDIRQSHCPRIAAACGEHKRPAIPPPLKAAGLMAW